MASDRHTSIYEGLGAWIHYEAQLSYTWWHASEAAREAIGNPSFDLTTSNTILDKFKEMYNEETNNTGAV